MKPSWKWFLIGLCGLALTGCTSQNGGENTTSDGGTNKESTPTDSAAGLKWYMTCGDPACGGHRTDPNVSECTTEKAGDACTQKAQKCDPKNDCNAHLVCTDQDPKGNCPISRKAAKRDIRYLREREQRAMHQALMRLRLATYRYKHERATSPKRLGFMIDDKPPTSLLYSHKRRVDLYSYISMVTAALQVQAKEIAALKRKLHTLQRRHATDALVCQEHPSSPGLKPSP